MMGVSVAFPIELRGAFVFSTESGSRGGYIKDGQPTQIHRYREITGRGVGVFFFEHEKKVLLWRAFFLTVKVVFAPGSCMRSHLRAFCISLQPHEMAAIRMY